MDCIPSFSNRHFGAGFDSSYINSYWLFNYDDSSSLGAIIKKNKWGKKMKKETKRNLALLLSSGVVILGCLAALFVWGTGNIEGKVKKEIEQYTFSKGSPLEGMKIKINDVDCLNIIKDECDLKGVTIFSKKNDNTTVDLFVAETVTVRYDYKKAGTFFIQANQLDLAENMKKSIFMEAAGGKIAKIGQDIYKSLFPINLLVDTHSNIIKQDIAEILINIGIENNSFKLKNNTEMITKNKPYTETLQIKKEDPNKPGEDIISEMKGSFPVYIKMNNFSYSIENKNIPGLLYNFYKLNMLNYENHPKAILGFNNFYLGSSTEEVLSFEEFSKLIPSRINEFLESIPNDLEEFRDHLKNISKIFEDDYNTIVVTGKNVDGSSIERLNMSLNLKDYREQVRLFYESYEIKTSSE